MMHNACVSGSIRRRGRVSARCRGSTDRPFSQGLILTILLVVPLIYLSGCGPGQTDVGQANGNNVPVNLNISMPQESAAASTSGSRFLARFQSWLPSVTSAWAVSYPDMMTLTVEVTGPDLPSMKGCLQSLHNPKSGDVIKCDLDVPVGPDRIFTVFGVDATKRTIRRGNSRPRTLTLGKPESVDITLMEKGVTETGSLTEARANHTATLLPNGKILVVGGRGEQVIEGRRVQVILNSVELFDPATNQWASRARLTDAREQHTATLLQNGKVLVVGGNVELALLFDPEENKWTPLPPAPLTNARLDPTATLLQTGEVLVVGGNVVTDSAALKSAQLFDPATNKWSRSANDLTDAREDHTATLLKNWQVLVIGGGSVRDDNGLVLKSAELFDPKTKTWTRLATGLTDAREDHTATLLQNGQVLVVGGQCSPSSCGTLSLLKSAELFDLSLL